MGKSYTAANKKIGNLLLKLGLIDAQQFEKAVASAETSQQRVEDAVIDLGMTTEQSLLKALAAHHKSRFVSTEKLAKADIVRSTLEMVPRQVAETFQVFPVLFDAQSGTLSIVTADPDDKDVVEQIRIQSGARTVHAFVGRPAGVRAAIAKGYGGDIHAFAMLDRAAHAQFSAMLDVYERNVVSTTSLTTALARESTGERVVTEREMTEAQRRAAHSTTGAAIGKDELLELLNVLVSLLEAARPDLRGHSALVGRLVRRMLERINVSSSTLVAIVSAAYLHDIGKMSAFHLTALNVSEYEGHKTAAQRAVSTPARVVQSVHFSKETIDAIEQMYERYDGKGLPSGLSGKDISLGARVLAIADTYADLTQNPRNPYRKALGPAEACGVLAKHKDAVFDPHLVDLFKNMVMGEDIRAKLLSNRYYALLIDPDPEETTVLELRLIEQGFETKTARAADQALKMLAESPTDIVISEVDLPTGSGPADGLALLEEVRKQTWGAELPWIFHTRRQGRTEAQRAFELRVADFVAKPAPTDVFVAKIKSVLDQRAARAGPRGVSGSLKEMGLPELVQVLFHGRKTGNLRIRAGSQSGEIHFQDGKIVNALFDKQRGADAFYQMLKIQDGEFGLDPSFTPTANVIQESPEALLLEGMRRMDEGM